MKSWIKRIGIIGAILVFSAACTPSQLAAWYANNGISTANLKPGELDGQAAAITGYWDHQALLHRYDYALTDTALARLRHCESTNNYGAVSSSGAYRGAYQFSQQTWNGVASSAFGGDYSGWDPVSAPSEVQDAFTRALFLQRGRAPWPVCGYRI